MRDYPEAHIIHEAKCAEAPPGLFVFRARALQSYPNSRPHTCFTSATVAYDRLVVAEPGGYQPHDYLPSTIRPDDATRSLCAVCRGTHPVGQPFNLLPFLGVGAAR